MKPKKLKELLVFSIVHRSPELSVARKEKLEKGLMKLNTDELEVVEEIVSELTDQNKTSKQKHVEDEEKTIEETA
ncbi:hypothetical protein ACR6EC_12130 [Bacillus subtilis]|uniref:hypothetical protein n=1 Tax=Bacillus subtilis TaxID=1423 RepID=UPI000A0F79E2|nr:hypothetical protein [Bacillus subtilis]MEC2266524.1 hypothetical protein [Bacillus subtilis]MEC4031912.1 hypothetical protein [Bacillus subtilis]MUG00734.1 hypothetical protein [Bacillus tequilensis]